MDAKTDMNSGVYWIVNRANNKRYLGSSGNLKNRWREHKSKLKRGCHDNYHLQSAWNIYGEEKFEFQIVAYMDADKALAFEDYLLKNYPNMFEYNIARDATAPMRGREFSEEHRQKLSEAHSGKNCSEETRKKMSESLSGENHYNFGKHLSDETREKISKALAGMHLTEATRTKISEALTGKHPTEKTRKKISESCIGNKNSQWIDISEDVIMEMKSLRGRGYTYEKIAAAFGISTKTAWRRLNNISESKYQ